MTATTVRYLPWALKKGAIALSFSEMGISNSSREAQLKTPNQITDGDIVTLSKQPEVKATTFNIGLLAGIEKWTGTAEAPALVLGYRAFTDNEGATGAFKTFSILSALAYPVALKANFKSPGTLQFAAKALFDAQGNCLVVGSDDLSDVSTTPDFCYVPKSVTIGTTSYQAISDIAINWNHKLEDNDQVQPLAYFLESLSKSGTITLKDLGAVTAEALKTGFQDTVTAVFQDLKGGADVTVPVGKCNIKGELSGQEAQLSFVSLAE